MSAKAYKAAIEILAATAGLTKIETKLAMNQPARYVEYAAVKPVERKYSLILDGYDEDRKIPAIKCIRFANGMGLKDAKELSESLPAVVVTGELSKVVAAQKEFDTQGVRVSIREED